MNFSNLKALVCTLFGMLGSFVAGMFGGWTEDIVTLVIFMSVDFVMGLILAGVFKKSTKSKSGTLDSHAGWMGLCKKCITLLFVLVAHRLDLLFGSDYIRTAAIIGFIANETLSIVENAGLMGLPLPKSVKRAVEILKNMEDSRCENNK